jgi:hypothetical protein
MAKPIKGILFNRADASKVPHSALYSVRLDGSGLALLASDPKYVLWGLAWSPDGQEIVFWSDRFGTPDLFVMNRDGSNLFDLTRGSGLDAELPAWSPDGSHILFHGTPVKTGVAAWVERNILVLIGVIVALCILGLFVVALSRRKKLSLPGNVDARHLDVH